MSTDDRRRGIRIQRLVFILTVFLAVLVVAGCRDTNSAQSVEQEKPVIKEGINQIGPWRYEYSIANKGTRSEGYYGNLFFNEEASAVPAHINDYYETPWGRLYWVGHPPVLFGSHGWMTNPLIREPVGQALADPTTLAEKPFIVMLKVLTAEELGTPDQREHDVAILDALKPFGLQEAHVQRNWLPIGYEWITLHNTKRWGSFELSLADPNQSTPPAIVLRSSGEMTIDTTGQSNPFEALLTPPTMPGTPKIMPLPPQAGSLRVFKCTLSGILSDSLELYLLCRIEESKTNPSQP